MEIGVWLMNEILYSPINLILLGILIVLLWRLVRHKEVESGDTNVDVNEKTLPNLRRDFTVEELREYDGHQHDGRILIAVNGSIYDVTKGKHYYGPGGPYCKFAGRDASRGLATFSVQSSDEYDDLSDLKPSEMAFVHEWEEQIKERYLFVGKLLKPGEEPSIYPECEDQPEDSPSATSEQN